MGTQGNGSRVSAIRGGVATWGLRQNAFAKLSTVLSLLMIVIALWTSTVRAQTTNYVYDADGRVVAVTQNNGTTAQYTYDTLGHLAQTTTVTSGQLAIFAFTPTHGESGAQVTIEGQGFSASPASDSVSFNGTPATVVSASATQIVTMVPGGATTGPISVSTAGNTAVSARSFVVDSTGLPPTIAQVSPAIVIAGSTVTISGTDLDPISGETTVTLGGTIVALSSATETQLQFIVPSTSGGGYVTVKTPYGQATSVAPIQVLPSGVSPSNVVSSGTATTNGAGITLSMSAGGQIGLIQFSGGAGNWLSLQLSSITSSASSIAYVVYGPGNAVIAQGTVSSSSPSIHLPQLTATGAYYATFEPSNASAQLTVAVVTDAMLTAAPISVMAAAPLQSERLIFTASTDENLELTVNGVNVPGGSSNQFLVYIYTASGTQVGAPSCYASNPGSSCQFHLWNLPAGTYTVTVVPNYGGTVNFHMLLAQDTAMPALTTNTPTALSIAAGQVQRFTFNATAGQTVALKVAATTTPTASNTGVTLWVIRPDAGVVTTSSTPYTSFDTYNTNTVNLSNLPVSGTYTVIAAPDYGLPASGQIELVAGETGNLATNGASTNYADTVANQNIYLSFTATQGENLEFQLSGLTLTGGGNSATVYVYNAAGSEVTYFNCYSYNPAGDCLAHLWNLAAGIYSAVIIPQSGNLVSFSALVQDDIVGSVITLNGGVSLNLGVGQVERFTFNATAGQTLALNLAGTSTPAGQGANVYVYRPDAGTITGSTGAYASFNSATTPTANLTNLPLSGTYTVIVAPSYGVPLTGQLQLISGVTATLPVNSSSQAIATTFTNQDAYLSFTAQQGENLELTFNGISGSNSGAQNLEVNVYNSIGQQVANSFCPSSTDDGSCITHLWNMSAGNYTVTVAPYNSGTMEFNTSLQDDIIGPAISAGAPTNITLAAGQVERLTFNATQGQTIALQLSNVATTPSISNVGATFAVYAPNVGVISTGTGRYASVDMTGAQVINLPNLPVTGTYTVIVMPDGGLPATAQLNLVGGVTGTVPTSGAQQTVASTASGENAYFSFNAQEGANLELTINNLTATGTGYQSAYVTVYNSEGTQISSMSVNTNDPAGGNMLHLWDLAAGNYSVVVSPSSGANGGTMNFNIMLNPDVIEPTIAAGAPTEFSIGAGQVQRYTFNANAGDTVTLQFSGVVTTPSGNWLPYSVYRPDAGVITTSTSAYSSANGSSLTLTMSNLPVSGTYTLIVNGNDGVAATGTAYLTDTAGSGPIYSTPTLQNNGTVQSESGAGAGQSVTMTFDATAGQNMEVYLSDINVAGASTNGVRIDVYNPSGADLYGYYCYGTSPGGGCIQNFYLGVSGTYKIVVSTPWGGTLNFNAQVQPALAGGSLTSGDPVSVSLAQGQLERFTFTANAGDSVALNLSGASTTPGGQQVYVAVYRPDQGPYPAAYASTSTSSSGYLNLPNLPVSGTYTVAVYTQYGEPGNVAMTYAHSTPLTLTENGAAQNVISPMGGQAMYANFTANQGDNLELTLANMLAQSGSLSTVTVTVNGPNGNQISSTYCNLSNPGNDCRISLWDLAAGQYSVAMTPNGNGVMNFNVLLLADVNGLALALNTPTTVNLGVGQVQRLTFNATAGATYALSMSGVSTTPGGQPVYVNLYLPDGRTITTGNYYTYGDTSGANTLNLPTLPMSGNYTLVVYSQYGQAAQATLNMLPGVTGQLITNAAAETFATSAVGQNVYLTFNAIQNQNLELTLSNVTGSSVSVTVYDTNSTATYTSTSCSPSNPGASCTMSLWNIPSGTYSVIVTGGPASFNAQLNSDIAEPTLTPGATTNVSLGAGQVERYTFNGTAGQNLTLLMSNVATTPSGQYVYVCVYRPDTGLPTPVNCGNAYTYAFGESSGATLNMYNLPVTGTYTVVVGQSNYGLPANLQLALYTDASTALTTNGTVEAFTASAYDQDYYATFTANPGDNLELAFSNLSIPNNSFTDGVTITVYDQNGKTIISYDTCGDTGTCTFPLWNLAGGTYKLVVSPTWGGNMSFNVQLTQDVVEPALVPNKTIAVALQLGTAQRYSFYGTAGQSATLNLGSLAGVSNVNMYVLRPDGEAASLNQYGAPINYYVEYETTSTGGTLTLPYLPVTGNYTLILQSYDGEPATAQLTYSIGQNITVVAGGPSQGVVVSSAQNTNVGFTANAGDNLELSLNNIIATGGNNGALAITLYDANGNTVTNFNCYASSAGSGCNQPLWNLTGGVYNVVVTATGSGAVQFNAQLQADVVAGTLTANTPVMIGPNVAPSPVERFTFSANAGSNATLQLSGVNTTPAGQPMTVSVYRPDVGTITTTDDYQQFSTSSANTLQLSNLPVSGTYTVIVNANGAVGSAAQLTLGTQ